jgi:uncharacterized protein YjbJ (UPF0337 family)
MEKQRNQQNQQNQQNQANQGEHNQQLERKWNDIENSYREQYPDLTDEDTSYREGEFNEMTQRVADRTNRSREEVQNEIRDWQI